MDSKSDLEAARDAGLQKSDLEPCCVCNRGVAHGGDIHLYRLTVEQHILDPTAIQRVAGEEAMMGGGATGAALSSIMGYGGFEKLTARLWKNSGLVCGQCALRSLGAAIDALGSRATARDLEDEDPT